MPTLRLRTQAGAEAFFDRHVTHVYRRGPCWQVCRKNGEPEQFDAVVLTMPVPQILQLQGDVGSCEYKYMCTHTRTRTHTHAHNSAPPLTTPHTHTPHTPPHPHTHTHTHFLFPTPPHTHTQREIDHKHTDILTHT